MKMKTTLKYDVHYSTQSVNFLDTTIKLENDQLLSDVYAKPTDAHFYLRYDSCHPRHCKPGILKSQFLRLRRICSDSPTFFKRAQEYKNYFLNRGYPNQMIEKAIQHCIPIKRSDLLSNKPKVTNSRVPCVVTYHPKISQLPNILHKHFNVIKNSNNIDFQRSFPEPPVVAYRQQPNIRNKLIHTDHIRVNKQKNNDQNRKCNIHTSKKMQVESFSVNSQQV